MSAIVTLLGCLLILAGLLDVFRTLFRPGEKGNPSKLISHAIWRGFRMLARRWHSTLALAGPVAFVATAFAWELLLICGWGLVYWQYMPDAFGYSPGLTPEENAGLLDALYLSMVTQATLGYGEIAPVASWLRIVAPLQALVGFLLLSAVVTWLLSIYPDLSRREALARYVNGLRDAADVTGIDPFDGDPASVHMTMQYLTTEVITIRGDMADFPITYYFHSRDDESSLAGAMPYLVELAARGIAP